MAKQSGLGDYIAVDDSGGSARDISNDVSTIEVAIPQNLLEATGIDKSAMERIIGLGDGTILSFNDFKLLFIICLTTDNWSPNQNQENSLRMILHDITF